MDGADSRTGLSCSAGAWVLLDGVLEDGATGAGVGLGFQQEDKVRKPIWR